MTACNFDLCYICSDKVMVKLNCTGMQANVTVNLLKAEYTHRIISPLTKSTKGIHEQQQTKCSLYTMIQMSLLANYFQRENFPIYKSLNAKIGYSHSHIHVKKFSRTCLLLLSFPAQGAVGGRILYI